MTAQLTARAGLPDAESLQNRREDLAVPFRYFVRLGMYEPVANHSSVAVPDDGR